MLTAAFPAAFAGLAALPILWWLHRARLRPRELEWPSLLLWRRLPPPAPQAVARYRRRASLTLFLAMGAAAVFTAGAAGLSAVVRQPEVVRVAVIVDATASARGAWDEIRADAEAVLAELPGNAVVDLTIEPVESRTGLSIADARLRLAGASPTDAPGDPGAAAARAAGADAVVVISARSGPEGLGTWRVHPAGGERGAVESLSIQEGELIAVLRNRGAARRMPWVLRIDGSESRGDSAAPADGRVLLRLPAPGAHEVSLSLEPDGFPSNDARFWVPDPGSVPVSLAGRDFPALRRALEGAGLSPFSGSPPAIWIGSVPDAPPDGPAILIDPPRGVPGLFEVGEALADPEIRILEINDRLVRVAASSDLSRLRASRATRLRFLRETLTLVDPLIFRSGNTLVLAFDPSAPNSNWTRLVSFPLFWADAARIFRPGTARRVATGASVPWRDGPRQFHTAGIHTLDGTLFSVNLEDPAELSFADNPAVSRVPRLDLPEKSVIRSRWAVPPAGAALAGLFLLALSWLAARRQTP